MSVNKEVRKCNIIDTSNIVGVVVQFSQCVHHDRHKIHTPPHIYMGYRKYHSNTPSAKENKT